MTTEHYSAINRRKFLKTSTALGAGLALGATSCGSGGTDGAVNASTAQPTAASTEESGTAPKSPAPEVDGAPAVVPADVPTEKINLAIIGCGQQGAVLMTSIIKEATLGIRFKAVCDISPFNLKYRKAWLPKMCKQDVTVNAYTDYQDMLASEKDLHAVIVATPDWMHAEHAMACMKAGLHVYCEKEMSNDIAKAREMVRVSREAGKLLQIGHQRRSSPRYRFVKQELLDGTDMLGLITHAHAQWNRSVATRSSPPLSKSAEPPPEVLRKYGYETLDQYTNWRWYRRFGGGPICDLGSHQIDVLGWYLGVSPARLIVDGGQDYWRQHEKMDYESYDNVRVIYHFPTRNGLVRALYQTLTTTSALGYYESLMGTQGTLTISENPARCRVYAEGYLTRKDSSGHPWDKYVNKGLLKNFSDPTQSRKSDNQGGLSDIVNLYNPSPPPVQFSFGLEEKPVTLHGPHLRNFFNAIRGTEKLNCPGEVGYECAVQVLKVNQLLDAGKDSGTFEESEFNA